MTKTTLENVLDYLWQQVQDGLLPMAYYDVLIANIKTEAHDIRKLVSLVDRLNNRLERVEDTIDRILNH